jgi:uncharacterized protein
MIVADAGPLIIFARMGRLPLLHDIVETLTIPPAVYAEITISGMAGAEKLARAKWINRVAVTDPALSQLLPSLTLHAGEREAIALAKEHAAQLLIDELRGRRIATELGIDVIGSLRLLADAKKRKNIDAVRPIIVEMQSRGYRLDRHLIRRFMERMGEA